MQHAHVWERLANSYRRLCAVLIHGVNACLDIACDLAPGGTRVQPRGVRTYKLYEYIYGAMPGAVPSILAIYKHVAYESQPFRMCWWLDVCRCNPNSVKKMRRGVPLAVLDATHTPATVIKVWNATRVERVVMKALVTKGGN